MLVPLNFHWYPLIAPVAVTLKVTDEPTHLVSGVGCTVILIGASTTTSVCVD